MTKPSHEILPIVYKWFNDQHNDKLQHLAALLLAEFKCIFVEAIEPLKHLLKSENDQMRYRAQRVFQHPDRDVKKPSKKVSVIGERVVLKLLESKLTNEHTVQVRAYLRLFFFDVLWDCPKSYENILNEINRLRIKNSSAQKILLLDIIKFIDSKTWNKLVKLVKKSNDPSNLEELLISSMGLAFYKQISENDWTIFSKILFEKNINSFKNSFLVSIGNLELVGFCIEQVQFFTETDIKDTINEFMESIITSKKTIRIEEAHKQSFEDISLIYEYNFYCKKGFTEGVLNKLENIPITLKLFENLLVWLIERMKSFNGINDSHFSLYITNISVTLVAGLAQKEDYIYRKLTNSPDFNKLEFTKLLEKILNNHRYFDTRTYCFILLGLLDQPNPATIISGLNILFDENVVKEYSLKAIPLIHLSANDFTEKLLQSLNNESAVKIYELLKIITNFAMDDKKDAKTKSKILNFLLKESSNLSSKKSINYYYTEVRIPFTTTLEKEFYKSWVKIQGLSGKVDQSLR